MPTKLTIAVFVLLICLCIIISGCCANSDKGSDNYKWYIKIYTPDGCIEGPGTIINWYSYDLVLVEIDGIQYKVGSQNFLARKLPEP